MTQTILMTGGNSFIGRHCISQLLMQGHQVFAIIRTKYENTSHLEGCRVLYGDLHNIANMVELDNVKFDSVLHIAGTSEQDGVNNQMMVDDNVSTMLALVTWAVDKDIPSFVFSSSISLHGKISGPVLEATTTSDAPSIYGLTKHFGERLLAEQSQNITSFSVRLPGIVGPEATERIWLHRVVSQLKRNETVTIFNPNSPFNNIVHVGDLARFFVNLLSFENKGNTAFSIGAADEISIYELIHALKRKLGSSSEVFVGDGAQSSFIISNSVAMKYGYKPARICNILDQYISDLSR